MCKHTLRRALLRFTRAEPPFHSGQPSLLRRARKGRLRTYKVKVYFIITDQNKFCVKFPFLTEILTSPCYDGHSNSERMMKMTHAKKAAAQVVLLIAGAAMLCFGAWRGEAATVFSKAIKLCLECVGIG